MHCFRWQKKKKDHFLQVLQASNFPKNKIEIPQMYFPCDKFQCIFSASVLKISIWDSSFSDVKIFGRHRIKQEEKLDIPSRRDSMRKNMGRAWYQHHMGEEGLKYWEGKFFSSGSIFLHRCSFLPSFFLPALWLAPIAASMVIQDTDSGATQPQLRLQHALAV